MNRKHMPLLIGGAAVLLLVLVLGYLLVAARGRYAENFDALAREQNRLARLTSRGVFPSPANVQTLNQQAGIYQEYLDGLYRTMQAGQIESEPIGRARFPLVLEEVLGQLFNDARQNAVKLPPDFSFSFERYAAGNLPAEDEVERLAVQLRSVAELVEILYEAGISELVSVERVVFEKEALAAAPAEEEYSRRSRRNLADAPAAAPVNTELYQDPDGLYTKEHYALSFRGPVKAGWAALDRFSQGTPFTVLTKVEVSNLARPAVVAPKAAEAKEPPPRPVSAAGWQSAAPRAAAAEKKEPEVLSRELRVVAGQELPLLHIELDVYRFAGTAAGAGEGEQKP